MKFKEETLSTVRLSLTARDFQIANGFSRIMNMKLLGSPQSRFKYSNWHAPMFLDNLYYSITIVII